MTCNPKWKEITEQLFDSQQPKDRPDLFCDVFKRKIDQFIDDVVKNAIFGKVQAYVWVIEFQKRGLPHLHMLLILEDEYKFKSNERIDQFIKAEIPSKLILIYMRKL